MEGGDDQGGNGGSRWNPTKEQIRVLEGLYRQGVRTPSAEQIQEITGVLRAHGHIEGKNVFYWFQNHKARQRQKQKLKLQNNQRIHHHFGYYNHHRTLHPHQYPYAYSPPPLFFPPPHPNVVCSPCYIPNDRLGFYNPQLIPKVRPPPTAAAAFLNETLNQEQQPNRYNKGMHDDEINFGCTEDKHRQETLDLFPIHPTGILQTRSSNGIIDEEEEEEDDDDKNPNSAAQLPHSNFF